MPAQGSLLIDFDDNSLLTALFGEHDQNLARLEQKLEVSLTTRGNRVLIGGDPDLCERAKGILTGLYARLQNGQSVSRREVDDAIRLGDKSAAAGGVVIHTRKRTIQPRSPNQIHYARYLMEREMVFGIGPAGTGKTYLAVAAAVSMMLARKVDRIVLSRPAVEAGERLGFLPGDLKDKVDPYLRPLYDALYDMLPAEQVAKKLETGEIEVAPLAFMRGRTLANAYVILDEAQNTTPVQMKMLLTRLGENSRMVITGDLSQVDLPRGIKSGLREALDVLSDIEEIGFTRFNDRDVVRHPLVTRIVQAYDRQPELFSNGGGATGLNAPAPQSARSLHIDFIEQGQSIADHEAALSRAASLVWEMLGDGAVAEVSVAVMDDAAVAALNAEFRAKDKPTDVLSFPAEDEDPFPGGATFLGDIALAVPFIQREATLENKDFAPHLTHLFVHGLLHLLGYDHERTADAQEMEALEIDILARLGIANPYAGRELDSQEP